MKRGDQHQIAHGIQKKGVVVEIKELELKKEKIGDVRGEVRTEPKELSLENTTGQKTESIKKRLVRKENIVGRELGVK